MQLNDFVQELKDRVDIVEVVSEYVELKRAGSQFKGLCPFHPEKTPSFFVNPERQFFHCFGCGEGGDVISFVMKYEGLEFMEALEVLAKRAGLSMESLKPSSSGAKALKDRLLEANTLAMRFYQKALKDSAEAREYINKRGVSEEVAEVFSLGYAPPGGDRLIGYLRSRGLQEHILTKVGLARTTQQGRLIDMFRQRLMFPIFNPKAEVVGFGGRTLSEEQLGPKYLNTPETMLFKKSQELFGLYQARDGIKQKGYVIVTEGYLDVISAYQAGIKNVVAPLGTALTEQQARVLKRYTDKVLLVFDSDEAGVKASMRAALVLVVEGLQPKVLLLPQGEDLDSFIKTKGPEALRRLFPGAMPVVDFFLRLKGDRLRHIRTLTEAIARVQDPILRGALLQELADKARIPQEMLLEEIKRKTQRFSYQQHKLPGMPSTEELLLALFVGYPEIRQKVSTYLSEEMFTDLQLREIYSKVSLSVEQPIQEILSNDEFKRISSILVRVQIDEDAVEKTLFDSIKKIKAEKIKKQIAALQEAISQAEKNEPDRILQLQKDLQTLMKEAKNEGLL